MGLEIKLTEGCITRSQLIWCNDKSWRIARIFRFIYSVDICQASYMHTWCIFLLLIPLDIDISLVCRPMAHPPPSHGITLRPRTAVTAACWIRSTEFWKLIIRNEYWTNTWLIKDKLGTFKELGCHVLSSTSWTSIKRPIPFGHRASSEYWLGTSVIAVKNQYGCYDIAVITQLNKLNKNSPEDVIS